jgi:hypothetical protein
MLNEVLRSQGSLLFGLILPWQNLKRPSYNRQLLESQVEQCINSKIDFTAVKLLSHYIMHAGVMQTAPQ